MVKVFVCQSMSYVLRSKEIILYYVHLSTLLIINFYHTLENFVEKMGEVLYDYC